MYCEGLIIFLDMAHLFHLFLGKLNQYIMPQQIWAGIKTNDIFIMSSINTRAGLPQG